jgi:H/ACA ribonucleoprotein complex subunit 3
MVKKHLRKCVDCEEYTLNVKFCPKCGGKTMIPHPAKFSPDDKYAKYRRMMKYPPKKDENQSFTDST